MKTAGARVTQQIAPSLQKSGLVKGLAQVFRKKPFGSLDEIRIQGSLQNPGVRMQVPTAEGVVIDCYLLVPKVRPDEQSDSLALRASLIAEHLEKHEVLERPLSRTSEEELRRMTAPGACELEGSTVALYCLPNAGLYELGLAYESETVDLYRGCGVFCLFWNYRGYGHSQGSTSMQSMVEDGRQLAKLVRHGFKADSLVLHGRSLGGHVVKALAGQADLVVIDRSFTSISMIPRDMFGRKWVQVAYELFVDNYEVNVDCLLAKSCPKVLLADTKVRSADQDEIINYPNSLAVGVMAELLDPYLGLKRPMLRDAVASRAPWLRLLPGSRRVCNALYQARYYDWVARSLDCCFCLLPRPQATKLFNVLASMHCRAVQFYRHHHLQAGLRDPGLAQAAELTPSPEASLLESSTATSGTPGSPDEAQEFQEPNRDYYDLLAAIEKTQRGAKFSERLVNFLCALEGGGVLLEAVFEDEDVAANFKLFQSLLLGSLVWGAGSHRAMEDYRGHVSYLTRLEGSVVGSGQQACFGFFASQALALKPLLEDIRRNENDLAVAAASQVAGDLDFLAKSLTAFQQVLRRALTVFAKSRPDLAQTLDPANLSDLEGSEESEQLIGCLAESGFLHKREQISLVFVE